MSKNVTQKDLDTDLNNMNTEQLQRGVLTWLRGASGGAGVAGGDAAVALAAAKAQERAAVKAQKKAPADAE